MSAETLIDDEAIVRPPAPPRWRWYQTVPVLLTAVAVFGGLFALGLLPRLRQEATLAAETVHRTSRQLQVEVTRPRSGTPRTEAVLPGDVRPLQETGIHARTSGYVSRWLADIGDHVDQGQLLVEISTPEVDQQLREAAAELERLKAVLRRSEAEERLAEVTWQRYQSLLERKVATQQEVDQGLAERDATAAAVVSARAAVASAEARLQRIREVQSFSQITAPFSGTITSRTVEVGQLVTADNRNSPALYTLAQTNPVRVMIDVPQVYAMGIRRGMMAQLHVRELPGQSFAGEVARTAGALDPATRTLRTEIQVPNEDGLLLAGSYVQVRLDVERKGAPLLVPATALMFNAQGTRLAIVDEEHRVRFRQVEVAGEYGDDVGISTGVTTDELVVVNPGEYLTEGDVVQVRLPDTPGEAVADSP